MMPGQKRTVGAVTGATTVGGALGAAIAQIIAHFVTSLQPVETAVTIIVTALLAVVSGYLVPPQARPILAGTIETGEDDDFGPQEEELPDHEATVNRPPSQLGVDDEDQELGVIKN
ncbi:hypothetical protein QDX25_07190 [Auritidibacter ignavus]|uniref:hypothetical protein n=1 Tax=Auritidibacter ignavus TaxID=678932 RepID=UPI002449C738|nr:hypothetical protein [Auritidibacter ignavus]WGH80592.1 hypothetical protein QDX25_07190 [Auritidibacter ignavus]